MGQLHEKGSQDRSLKLYLEHRLMVKQQFPRYDADSASPCGTDLLTDQLFWIEQASQVVYDLSLLFPWHPRVSSKQHSTV